MLYSRVPYSPPPWLAGAVNPQLVPTSRLVLGRFPTPVHPFRVPRHILPKPKTFPGFPPIPFVTTVERALVFPCVPRAHVQLTTPTAQLHS